MITSTRTDADRARDAAYRNANRARLRAYKKKWAEENKERVKSAKRKYYEANKEACKVRVRQWLKDHAEAYEDRRKAYALAHKEKIAKNSRKFRETHAEKLLDKSRAYYAANEAHLKAYHKKYREVNRQRLSAYRLRWKRLKRRSDAEFMLKERMRAMTRRVAHGKGCMRSAEVLGFTSADLLRHLKSQFTEGMTIEKLLSGEIHIDHIMPVASFGITSIEDPRFLECFGLNNLQPLWAADNRAKSDKVPTTQRGG